MSYLINIKFEGVESFAGVTEHMNGHQILYSVSFQDGYENNFYRDVESGKWIEEDLGFTDLALEVGSRLKTLMKSPFHVPKILTWHYQFQHNKVICFGFFNFMNGSHKHYQIYDANRKYTYTLVDMDNDVWQIQGNSLTMNRQIDTSLAHRIIQILSSYTASAE